MQLFFLFIYLHKKKQIIITINQKKNYHITVLINKLLMHNALSSVHESWVNSKICGSYTAPLTDSAPDPVYHEISKSKCNTEKI